MFLNLLTSLALHLLLPGLLIAAAWILTGGVQELAALEIGLLRWLPILVGSIGAFLALRFSRLRIGAALLNFLAAYALLVWLLPILPGDQATATAALAAVFLATNHLACALLPESLPVMKSTGMLSLALLVEGLLLGAMLWIGGDTLAGSLTSDFLFFIDANEFGSADLGFLACFTVLGLSFARLYQRMNPQLAAMFALAFCLFMIFARPTDLSEVIPFATAGLLILTIAAFQETWNIAYLDPLTELPARRALDEALARLDGQYAIAMMDVDHFKSFNDTHGHDVGDQVLRMVASRLREVSEGGKAFRYGGEEFTLLFPGKTAKEAKPEVDRLRELIGSDTFEIRRQERREAGSTGAARRPAPVINITISGGLAEHKHKQQTAEDIIKAADEALYAAKKAGRDCVKISRKRG
ncbi:MAG: GGDEF domain-containing protein [Gammaproteobacteria bacterium]|nr:GGDEF domain-containing protein [Gammaproteobacteria bacterium]